MAGRPGWQTAEALDRLAEVASKACKRLRLPLRELQFHDTHGPGRRTLILGRCYYVESIVVVYLRVKRWRQSVNRTYGSVLETLMHECAHLRHGGHPAEFWDLLDNGVRPAFQELMHGEYELGG